MQCGKWAHPVTLILMRVFTYSWLQKARLPTARVLTLLLDMPLTTTIGKLYHVCVGAWVLRRCRVNPSVLLLILSKRFHVTKGESNYLWRCPKLLCESLVMYVWVVTEMLSSSCKKKGRMFASFQHC